MPKQTEVERIRSEMGLSQSQFADRLGVHQSTVSRLEKGRAPSRLMRRLLDDLVAETRSPAKEAR